MCQFLHAITKAAVQYLSFFAGAFDKTWAVEVDARPVHGTAQHPFQDVMAQSELCGQDGATHAVV
jgi:hypothetical protein